MSGTRSVTSMLAVMLANLIPLYQVWIGYWTLSEVISLYWLENLVVGIFHWIKLLACNPRKRPRPKRDREMINSFLLFYGLFTLFQGVALVAAYFVIEFETGTLSESEGFSRNADIATFWWALAAMSFGHAYAFYRDFIHSGQRVRATVNSMSLGPLGRIAVLQFVLIGGGILAAWYQQPLWALVVLVSLKILADLFAQWRGGPGLREGRTSGGQPKTHRGQPRRLADQGRD